MPLGPRSSALTTSLPAPSASEGGYTPRSRSGLVRDTLCVSVLFALTLAAGCSRTPPVSPTARTQTRTEDFLAAAREDLLKSGDLPVCQSAVRQLNQHLGQQLREKRPELTDAQRKVLEERFRLTTEELGEVASGSLTLLDAHHLEGCLLFRDAARSLAVEGRPAGEQAAAAFQWSMRQVRLRAREAPAVPPQVALRRGWGSALERSLVFLAVLQQLGIDGCLVALPGPSEEQPRHWLCGALLNTGSSPEIQLFDPRMGLPLPGPKGQGIATLAQLRAEPDLLKQLSAEKAEYDVTAEQARNIELRVVVPLSALAPRLKVAEELLGTGLPVRLAVEPVALLKKFEDAATGEGPKAPLRAAREVIGVLRDFVPPADGGTGKTFHSAVHIPLEYFPKLGLGEELERPYLILFQRPFRDFALEPRMPRDDLLRSHFIYLGKPSTDKTRMPFERAEDGAAEAKGKRDERRGNEAERVGRNPAGVQAQTEVLDRARMPRDLILRGKYDEAAGFLVAMCEQLLAQRERLNRSTELPKRLQEWHPKMITAQAVFLRAQGSPGEPEARRQRDQLWAEGDKYLLVVLEGMAAPPLLEEVTFQLALCKHEQADRLQARLNRDQVTGKTVPAAQANEVRDAWRDAAHWWDTFINENAARPTAAAATRWRAGVHEVLGDKAAAANLLEQDAPNLTAPERAGRAYEARRLKSP